MPMSLANTFKTSNQHFDTTKETFSIYQGNDINHSATAVYILIYKFIQKFEFSVHKI